MNANFKIFLSGLIIIVVAYFLIRRRKILEGFATQTASGKECIPWKNAVQFREYGDSKTCRNPESDVNGSWCYTDTIGNYEYCNSYTPGCMNMKILEGCFNPDKDGYQIVIYNSQPFNEDYLELDKIVDSTNQIWCLDKSGRVLRTTKKDKYVNYEWTDMINDSFNNYNPNSERFYLISGFGVKKGGYIDTQKNNKEEDVSSLMASEVCYIILRNYFNRRENKIMRCILSEQMNIQSDDPNYYINIGWRTSEREYIELADKISIDKNGYIFGIHREKIKEGKGLTWGDMVIGREDENGQILFSLLGETFPKDVSKITNYEYSDIEDSDENLGSRRFIVNTSKKLFNNKILKFVHKSSYIINDLLNKKDSRLITNFMNEIAGKTELQGDDAENVEQFNRYLRNRILLNKDFRFKEGDKEFTYTLSPEFLQRNGRVIDYANPVSGDSANNGIPINPVFDSEDMLGIMNEFEVIKHLNNVEKFTKIIQQIKPELVFTEEYENFNKIKKIDNDEKNLGLVMQSSIEDTNGEESITFSEYFVIDNIRSKFRRADTFTPTRNVIDEVRGILNRIKDIEMSGSNLDLKNRLQSVVTSFDNNIGNLKQEFDNSDIKKKYNLVLDKILEIQEKFDTTRTTETSKQSYFDNEFGEGRSANHKKIYYKIIYLMMDYFISRTSFLYDSISRSVTKLNEHFSDTDSIVDALKTGNCNLRDNNYNEQEEVTRGLSPKYYEEKIQEKIRTQKRQFGDRMKVILDQIKNSLTPNNRQSKDNIINHLEETRNKLERIVNLRGDLSELRGNHGIKICEYEYFPDNSPSVSHERNEYNCFQDFVTRQIVDLREIKQRMVRIYSEGKAKEVEVNWETETPVVELSDTDYVHPEIAEFLGESEIILENIARKEALLRYNTNFFYMLDELLEGEGENFSTTSYDTLSDDQQNIIKKMFKLFFDRVTNDDDMMETEAPIESPHDDYEMLSPSPSYEPKNLYNEEFLEQLYPRELLVESDYEQFESELNAPGASPAETLDENCDTKLSSKRFINKLNLRRKILNDVLINYKKKREIIDNIDFDRLKIEGDMGGFNFVDNLETACRAGKDILFDRLLVNYVRDDVQLFASGDVNVSQMYSNFFRDLKEVEEETEFNFDLTIMGQQRTVLFDSIINKYEDIYNRFRIVTNQTSANIDITNYLQSKDIIIENVVVSINNSLSQTYQRLVTNPRQNQDYLDKNEYTKKFNILQSHHTELVDFYQKLKESLMTIFPNRNILTYMKYLNDYNKTGDLDIIRKIEILKETQKIMGEISNLVVHQGIDMGVIDFNLTEKYLYIDYLAPSASAQNDRSLVAYDWSDTSTENLIKSFSIITVRLNKDYIDHVFESRYTDLRYLRYLDENDIIREIIPNDNENQFQQSITLSTSKVVTMFEKDEEGRPKKLLRSEHNIGREILQNYNNEFVNIYKDKLNDNNNENYEVLMRAILNMELEDEINKYKFVEQGKMFIKQNVNVDNKLHVYLKEYDSSKTARQQVLEYNEHVNNSVGRNEIPTKTNKVRYFHDFSDKEDHPNLMEEGTRGNQNDRMIYKIIPGSLTGSTSGYGIMRYNYTNSLNLGSDKEKELLSNVYFKRNVFFQIYGKEDRGTDAGPIELVNKTELNYILTPEIKYIHGLEYKEDGKIKRSDYYGLLYWFYLRQKEGKFVNVKQWYDYYKTLKMEGMYNIAADPQKFKLNTSFSNQFEEYVKSLESKPDIGRLDQETTQILLELANFSYDKELKIETQFPQIKLHRLKTKKYSNQVFVEVKRFNPNDDSEFNDIDRDILTMVADIDPNTERNLRTRNTSFLDKYSSHIQDMKNNQSFDYKYFKLVKQNKFDLLSDSDFCENSEKMNKYESLFRYKIIQNFSDYKNLVEDNEFGEDRDEATNRVKGLYDLNNIYKDEMYYQLIKRKRDNTKDLTVKETCKKILEDKKKNMLMGTGYPFMVIYQVRDYRGFPCHEGIKNSQRIFLTFNLKPNFIMDDITSSNNDLIDKKEGPLLSEEFLSYTGQGASIRFAFQKVKGNTPLKTKDVCPSAPYDPLPGYSDDCGTDGGCGNLSVGMTRLDGTPKCSLGDPEVKTISATPLDISILGNVPKDACDIYKVKGNKRVKYTLGKMFGYNDAGKYQLKNQYTLKYGDYYFYYQKKANKIIFKDEFLTDPEEVSKYAFNITYGEDNYGVYILLSPYLGPRGDNAKYLTRVINIFDKQFDGWALEKKMDKIDEKKKSYIRDKETGEKKIYGDSDLDFYAQKFNLPDDLVLKITSEEGIKSKLLDEMKSDLEKANFLFCNLGGQGESEICKGDFNSRPTMTLDEENAILRKQATQIESLMRRFDNVPSTHFTRLPQNEQLFNYINLTINTIKQASTFVYERVKDVNWVVKTQLESNAQVQNQVETQTKEKISNNKLMDQPMGDLVDEQGIMADALKSMKDMNIETASTNRQCKSIEGFTGGAPSLSPERKARFNRNISGRYYTYIKDEIEKKKQNITNLNEKIHTILTNLNQMSDGMDLSGEKKQMLLSELVQERNKLEKMMFDIKNYEQQDRITRIGNKLNEVEELREEMEEDNFMIKKPADDANNVSIISREDGEFLNMYRLNDKNTPDHLLFINGGCLEYEPKKKDIKVSHCMANSVNQQFNIYRVEDKTDMNNYNLKNADKGLDRAFDIVRTKDGKCLHKENGQLSFRKCDNTKNQYWDYSNVTGPCKM